VKIPGPGQIGAGVARISAESFLPQSLQQAQDKSLGFRSLEQKPFGNLRMYFCFVASTGKFAEFGTKWEGLKLVRFVPKTEKSYRGTRVFVSSAQAEAIEPHPANHKGETSVSGLQTHSGVAEPAVEVI
jgi:hypothetical protein